MNTQRKTELPPLHSGLTLNYQVLFPLMDELNKTQAQRIQASSILSKTFVMPEFRHKYFGDAYTYPKDLFSVDRALIGIGNLGNGVVSIVSGSIEWGKINIKIPAAFLTADSKIDINLTGSGSSYLRTDVAYTVSSVIRGKTNDINEFIAEITVPLDDVITISKENKYTLVFTIKTHEMMCRIIFSSPVGGLNFTLSTIE